MGGPARIPGNLIAGQAPPRIPAICLFAGQDPSPIPHTLIGSTLTGLFVWCSLGCKGDLYFTGCAINFAVGIKAELFS